jgi:hypothetical protein
MPINKINHPAALTAAIVYFLLGRFWYGEIAVRWLDAAQRMPADRFPQDPTPYMISFALGLLMTYATAIAMTRVAGGLVRGAQFGAFVGIAFVASGMLVANLFEGRPVALWLVDAGYPIIGLTIVGAIVGGWKRND